MKKALIIAPVAALALGACSVNINGEDIEPFRGDEHSLEVSENEETRAKISCTNGKEPYKEGGVNGEPLVMGCR
jgi:hypothetical protein